MVTRSDIENAIEKLNNSPADYQTCDKLATFYTLLDHIDSKDNPKTNYITENIIGDYGESDFLKKVRGKSSEYVWGIINELMETIEVLNQRLYESVMRKMD
jgi:hypothetical protein